MLYFILFLLCTGTLASVLQTNKLQFVLEDADKHFEDFIRQFDKKYVDETEKNMRFEIFKQNLVTINELNMDPEEDAEFGINNFADMTKEEMKSYTGFISPSKECTLLSDSKYSYSDDTYQCKNQTDVDTSIDIPGELDWRKKNVVTSVKNQGSCGSCWTFGTTGNVESMYAKKYGKLVDLSEQQLLDCDKNNHGCHGGTYNASFGGLVTSGGMMTLKDYPYEATQKKCRFDKSKIVAKVKDCLLYDPKDEEQLRYYVATNGPVSISIDASRIGFHSRGIIMNCKAGEINHAVLLVGYGTENGIKYWIIKNSWGKRWGEDGYFRVQRNVNACNLLNPCAGTAVIG